MSEPPAYGIPNPSTYGSGVPVCPRHPDRVSYVRCQRCGRPACPECQRAAPVGVQCADCVTEQAATVRQARSVYGGAVRPASSATLVTKVIITLCCVVWVGELLRPQIINQFALVPALGWSQPWRLLTGAFLHMPLSVNPLPLHLGLNMLSLWYLGSYLEPLLGRLRFAVLYLVSAIGGSVAVVLLAGTPSGVLERPATSVLPSAWVQPTIGASGAIFGLFGAMLLVNRGLRRSNMAMMPVLAINFAYSFLASGVSWQGHVGGFVTGLLCGLPLIRVRGADRRWDVPVMVVVAVIAVICCAGKYAGVPIGLK